MSKKIHNAVDRLNKILPLHAQQQSLTDENANLYQQLLRSFVDKGRILTRNEIARLVGNVDITIDELAARELIVCDSNNDPVGAYPFTMQQRAHRILVNGFTVHAMCALDALAISPMFNYPTEIYSQCHVSKKPIHIIQQDSVLQNIVEQNDISFAVNWNAASKGGCCADSLCMEMIFIYGTDISEKWQAQDSNNRELFTLQEAVGFATDFFRPLMV